VRKGERGFSQIQHLFSNDERLLIVIAGTRLLAGVLAMFLTSGFGVRTTGKWLL
tara:strand:- start:767 stop:928 length:162 start_codon:yes stop_codon:yes gene_type:complete